MKRRTANKLINALGGSMIAVGLALVAVMAIGIAANVSAPPTEAELQSINATGCKEGSRHKPKEVVDGCGVSEPD